MIIPISKNIIEPIIKTNITYVDSIEEFEKIELQPNETKLAFDNNRQCFYIRSRDKLGEYSSIMIYFYESFAERAQNTEKNEFLCKCQKAGLDDLKTEIACLFFLENKKPQDVWLWLLSNKKKDCEWDTIKKMKFRLKTKLFPELIKHKGRQKTD